MLLLHPALFLSPQEKGFGVKIRVTLNKTTRYQISVLLESITIEVTTLKHHLLTLMTLQAIGEYSHELASVMRLLHLLKGSGTNCRICRAVKEYEH